MVVPFWKGRSLALDMRTGEIVASMPVLDDLPEGYQVVVENSAIVYDDSEDAVSTIVCNWFGAGNADLAGPNGDSSIQSYPAPFCAAAVFYNYREDFGTRYCAPFTKMIYILKKYVVHNLQCAFGDLYLQEGMYVYGRKNLHAVRGFGKPNRIVCDA